MKALFRAILFVAFLFLLWKHGWPWLQARMDMEGAPAAGAATADDPGEACLEAAREARDVYGSGMRSLGPPGEADLSFRPRLEDAISRAHGVCDCSSPACERGEEALDLLEEASRQLEDPSRVGEAAMAAARRLQRIGELLDGS